MTTLYYFVLLDLISFFLGFAALAGMKLGRYERVPAPHFAISGRLQTFFGERMGLDINRREVPSTRWIKVQNACSAYRRSHVVDRRTGGILRLTL
ncbi:hypothetical protein BGW80DRAFT_1294316 [Lactifluus volemus]|nr:hypothetical protein BGW80DRAFT_1294316 [Lactifluus volemus]